MRLFFANHIRRLRDGRKDLNQRGFSLVEILVATAIIGASAAATTVIVSQHHANTRRIEQQTNRDTLFDSANRIISSPSAMFISATLGGAVNASLRACALGQSGDNACIARVGAVRSVYGFELYSPDDSSRASGAVGSPGVFYDSKTGLACPGVNAPTVACPVELQTSFEALCLDDALTCKQALSLKINYAITQHTSVDPNIPVNLKNLAGSIMVDTQQVSLLKEQIVNTAEPLKTLGCARNEMLMGFDSFGNSFCQRLDYLCPAGQVVVGVDKYGRPVGDFSTAVAKGIFDSVVNGIRCAPATPAAPIASKLLVGMNVPQSPTVRHNWMPTPITCGAATHSVLTNIIAPGTAQCLTLQSCQEANVAGNDVTQENFTSSFSTYNGPISAGGIVSACDPWGCPLGTYMGGWTAQNNCVAAAPSPPVPIPPACGTASGTNATTAPTSPALCAAGTEGPVIGPTGVPPRYDWTCTGQNGDTSVLNCSAGQRVNGACGTAAGGSTSTAPAANLCSAGVASVVSGPASTNPAWSWTCAGQNTGTTATCTSTSPPVNGLCNNALKVGTYASAPAPETRCTTGLQVGFIGPAGVPQRWTWSCAAMYGGTSDDTSCFATFAAGPINGICGASYPPAGPYQQLTTAPAASLCDATTPTVTAPGPTFNAAPLPGNWTWTCDGVSGGVVSGLCRADFDAAGAPTPPVCGTASGVATRAAPGGASLCNPGTASAVNGGATGPWDWTCTGINGNTAVVSCAAPIDPECGPANGTAVLANATISTGQCNFGTPSVTPVTGPTFNWNCVAGPLTAACSAPVNGACNTATTSSPGYAANKVFTPAEKCTAGAASAASPQEGGSGPWTWTCAGTNGGASPSCTALMTGAVVGRWCLETPGETACSNPSINPTMPCDPNVTPVGYQNMCTNIPFVLFSNVFNCVDVNLPCGAPSCPAQSMSWTDGPNSCQANLPNGTVGVPATANDSTAPTTGSATYNCTAGGWVAQGGATCTGVTPSPVATGCDLFYHVAPAGPVESALIAPGNTWSSAGFVVVSAGPDLIPGPGTYTCPAPAVPSYVYHAFLGYWWDGQGDPATGPYRQNPTICTAGFAEPTELYTCPAGPCTVGETQRLMVGAACAMEPPPGIVRDNFSAVYDCRCQ